MTLPKKLTKEEVQLIPQSDLGCVMMKMRDEWNTLIGLHIVQKNLTTLQVFHPDLGSAASLIESMYYESNIRNNSLMKMATEEEQSEYMSYLFDSVGFL
jgi:hypothetical protein